MNERGLKAREKKKREKSDEPIGRFKDQTFQAAPEPLKCSRLGNLDRLDQSHNVSSSSNPKFRDVRNMCRNDRSLSNFRSFIVSMAIEIVVLDYFFYILYIQKIFVSRIYVNGIQK